MSQQFKAPAVVLDELGITEPQEIVIEAIAQHCGATIVYEPLGGCEARILGSGSRAIITVNANAPRARQRFSAGHELGHWMRDRGKIAFSCSERAFVNDWGEDNAERRANRYAADLLLPRTLFASAARRVAPTFDGVRQLAAVFDTSLTATAIRLVEIGDAPAMILCNNADGRQWFYRSPVIPADLWPVPRPGQATHAAKILAETCSRAPGPATVDADEWIDQAAASKYALVEDSIGAAGGTVLTLLWWRDEAQIADLDEDEDGESLSGVLTFGPRKRR